MPEPNVAGCAMARAFIETMRKEAASPDPSWCLDEAEIDALATTDAAGRARLVVPVQALAAPRPVPWST